MARHRSFVVAAGFVVAGAFLVPPAAKAADTLVADLNGRAIPVEHVGRYNCHDFDYPTLHCFHSERELEASIADRSSGSLEVLAVTGITYVQVWEHQSYSGNTAYLSNDYGDLGSIGWNDKITSFAAKNSQSGAFYEHNWYSGFIYSFCCNSSVSNVGSSYNDKFSSVRNLT